ncbi:MAG: SemiSWEET transporter [FCB group bacterium]|nr:SemiSWEET transporter [FCB group bacterium]
MNLPDTIGLIAGFLTSTGFLPQFLKALKTKSTSDISAPMLLILAAGIILWLVYGLLVSAFPVIIANVLSLTFVTAILILKIKYK